MNGFRAILVSLTLLSQGLAAEQSLSQNPLTNTASVVRIVAKDAGFQLLRNGQSYFIKGAVVGPGGSLEALQAAGANSIRTHAGMLDEAYRHGFTALVGLPLGNPRKGFNYTDAKQVEAQFERVRDIVRKYRYHPALLCWNLGNEPEIRTTPEERAPLWKEANRLAHMVKQEDPDHPVMVVIGGQYADMLHELNEYCPALDLVGLNSYAQMLKLPEEIAKQGWTRPYLITEFGPRGHWQVPKTAWKVPIEDDANAKAEFYLQAYQHSVLGQPACLGSYVFYWAHKQEKTHTWYGMFLPDGSRTPAIDTMTFLWTGHWPTNRCPLLQGNKVTVLSADGRAPAKAGVFLPGTKLACGMEVSDPDNDPLRITWELRPDVADNPNVGGDWEPSVEPLPGVVLSTTDEGRRAVLQLPVQPGKYRVFAYAHDDHGNATTANVPLLAAYPAPPPWQPDPQQREHLRRALTLLQTSTPTDRKTVRILFYGQSITQQAWWKEVAGFLRAAYTNANLLIENRAIGGHSSQLLVKTAEADLYPFQPDLLIFHVYGSHVEYENILRRVRERTCADILLQTDHITQDTSLTEETDPAKLTPKEWDSWMNHVFLPATAAKYDACRADVHELWKTYLEAHHLKATDLLRDGVHLNAHGEWLMAELLKAYLAPLPPKAGYDPLNESHVRTVPVSASAGQDSFRVEFTGNRADVLLKPEAKESIAVLVDGKPPSKIPELYGFTRVSAFPGSDWPVLLKVSSGVPLVAEDWSLTIGQASPDGKLCHFALYGSATGQDGEGCGTNRFVSKSGRIVIEPEDWNLAYSIGVFKRPLPADHIATWSAVLRGTDVAAPPTAAPGMEACVTVAQGLVPGQHVLELRGPGLAEQVQAVRFYSPSKQVAGVAAEPAAFPLQVSDNQRYLVEAAGRPFLVVGDTAWSLIAQLSEGDIARYLDDRQQRGFNAIIVNLIEHKFASKAPASISGVAPFLKPGDFTQPNPAYFDYAHRAVEAAQRHGICVWLCPAYLGWSGGDEGFFKEIKAAGPAALRSFGRFVGQRFKDLPNIVWMLGGDYAMPEAERWAANELALGLREGGAAQIMTAHGGQTSAIETFGDQPWISVNTVYRYQPDLWRPLQAAFDLKPARPFVLIETTYEGEHDSKPEQIRRQAWWAILCGACGQFFGNNPMWHFDGPTLFPYKGSWQEALDSPGSRDIARMGKFFSERPWQRLFPDTRNALIKAGAGQGAARAIAAWTSDRRLVVIYVPADGRPWRELTLNLSSLPTPMRARWFNPAKDVPITDEGPTLENQDLRSIRTPGENGSSANDWVLLLE